MTQLSYSDIFKYVKAQLDELSNNDDAMLVTSSQSVEDLEKEIEAAVLPSVRKIHLDAPNVLLNGGESLTNQPCYPMTDDGFYVTTLTVSPQTITFNAEGGTQNVLVYSNASWSVAVHEGQPRMDFQLSSYKYVVVLPQNFLRLITLQMSDWSRPIQTLINEDSAEYRKQGNKFLMGTSSRPVGALVHKSGFAMLELYSCKSNVATMLFGQYVPEPEKAFNGIDYYTKICEPLRYPCLNQITANVLRIIGRAQEASLYDRMAVQPFYIDPDYARLNPLVGERFNTNK